MLYLLVPSTNKWEVGSEIQGIHFRSSHHDVSLIDKQSGKVSPHCLPGIVVVQLFLRINARGNAEAKQIPILKWSRGCSHMCQWLIRFQPPRNISANGMKGFR